MRLPFLLNMTTKLFKQCKYALKGLLTLSLFTVCSVSFAQIKKIPFKNGEAVIILKDELKNPFYWWPVSLLQYQLSFNDAVNPANFSLREQQTGKEVPFQLSEPTNAGKSYILNMLSDLPSHGNKTFTLLHKAATQSFPGITSETEGKFIIITTNKLRIRIPNSQTVSAEVPGPVAGLSPIRQPMMGTSLFQSGNKKLQKIVAEKISSGPVFIAYKLSYLFADGAKYSAIVKCINDYEFIELSEEISGIKKEDSVSWKMVWTGFHPTHRQAPNHPYGGGSDKLGFAKYDWETIDQTKLNYHHGIMPDEKESGKIPFEVGLYEPWPAERILTSSVFWDDKKNQSMGVFITDAASWNDKDYSIWSSSKILNIRFYHNNGLLTWQYPVAEGTRATAISCYPHQKDIDYMDGLQQLTKAVPDPFGFKVQTKMSQLSYNTFLQNRYGTIRLDKVKNWDLTYPDSLPVSTLLFKNSKQKNAAALAGSFLSNGYNSELTISGTRQNSGYGPTNARQFNDGWVDSFNRFYPELNKEQKQRVSANYLFQAYISADEEYMPMKYMLSGHPNFLADVKTIPALVGYQFPKHPEATNWADLFEKYVSLNTRYHTRPTVKAWNAQGGRWTENLGTYVWAFLRPTLRTAYVLQQSENGRNRVADPGMAAVGSWILNELSAPYNGESLDFYRDSTGKLEMHYWGIVDKKEGPRRVHPPQGAHAERRKPARSLWLLGSMLNNYDPLLAEHLRYVSKPTDDDMEALSDEKDPANVMYPKDNYDKGTKPDFNSIKMTGYGTILRAAVNTRDELSVHLSQIDAGPNYRTGIAGQGGAGMIYFYAGGKSYSHNGREDVGDRKIQDTDLLTGFGVYKDGYFKSIGANVLSSPLYDLGLGQYTEIVSSTTSGYAWPDYKSRSVMLVGSDYFITYDDVYNNNISGRFSWFTHPKEELPNIEIIKVGAPRTSYKKTNIEGDESKGVWYDMLGDCMAFVSHKKGFKVESTIYGAKITSPQKQTDFIFRNDTPVEVKEANMVFNGTAGFIRLYENQEQELVLFHGQKIGNGDFTINTADNDAGINAKLDKSGFISGKYYNLKPSVITFTWKEAVDVKNKFFLDGVEYASEIHGNDILVHFPAGEHQWQISKDLPVPARPEILGSEYDNRRVKLLLPLLPSTAKYSIELSRDNGETWSTIGETTKADFIIKDIPGLNKAHIRVTASNKEHSSPASAIYPVYFSKDKPSYPDGLKIALRGKDVGLTWGKVLGVSGYKLYRRKIGDKTFQVIYSGTGNSMKDTQKDDRVVYEYAISSVNKNGESVLSNPVSANPDSWLNWDPQPDEKFRRTNTKSPADKSPIYYPN